MKALPLNKFTVAALIWFAAAIYALLFKEGGNSAPPFPHFDKVAISGCFLVRHGCVQKYLFKTIGIFPIKVFCLPLYCSQ